MQSKLPGNKMTTRICTIVAIVAAAVSGFAVEETTNETYSSRMDRAQRLRLDGRTDEALVILNGILAQTPGDSDALVRRGYCYLRNAEMITNALSDFESVIQKSPMYVDAYFGASVAHRRLGHKDQAKAVLEDCEKACTNKPEKLKYLATTAWREGFVEIGRRIDEQYPPDEGRVLVDDPATVSVSYGYYWLENQRDWQNAGVSGSFRIRPDWSVSASLDEWWRYGVTDWDVGFGVSHRFTHKTSAEYNLGFSDESGFLADLSHSIMARSSFFRGTSLGVGAGMATYSGAWSRKLKLEATQYLGNFYGSARWGFGYDSDDKWVKTFGASIGYVQELQYSLSASWSTGDEYVEIPRGDSFIFRSDEVESVSVTGRYYLEPSWGVSLTGSYEQRNERLFRRGLSGGVFCRF